MHANAGPIRIDTRRGAFRLHFVCWLRSAGFVEIRAQLPGTPDVLGDPRYHVLYTSLASRSYTQQLYHQKEIAQAGEIMSVHFELGDVNSDDERNGEACGR